MGKLFGLFKRGFVTIFTSPFWLTFFIYKMIEGLFIYIYYLFKAIIQFFKGGSLFEDKTDLAIKKLIKADEEALAKRREEALNDVK